MITNTATTTTVRLPILRPALADRGPRPAAPASIPHTPNH